VWTVFNFLPLAGLAAAFVAVFAVVTGRRPGNGVYKCAVGLALAGAFVVIWLNLAVGIIGEPDNLANLMYVGVPAVGGIGGVVARFEPRGIARTLAATAGAQAAVGAIALAASFQPRMGLAVLNGAFVALSAGSAWVFERAAGASARGSEGGPFRASIHDHRRQDSLGKWT